MYLASLNIDLLFKKVFSDPEIAKSFLEDFLGIVIAEIIILGVEHKITNDAVIVRFDYRCKINGEYVIIEMQQKYKKDVIKRFYLYHCVGTSLQLETLKPIVITRPNGETYKEKDYSGVEPVLTIVWMVDDTLNFEDDFIVFTTLPEAAKDFITDETLWLQPIETILAARSGVLKTLNKKTKNLDFFQKNKIILLFQDNIAKNIQTKAYSKWCILAKKSKNPNNVEADFEEFKNNKVMAEVIRRLETTQLEPYEFKYVSDIYQYENMLEETKREAQQEIELTRQEVALERQEAARQKERAERAERAEKESRLKAIQGFLMLGKDIPYIAGILELTIEETHTLAQQIPRK
jgi:hypothetical protein